MRDSPRTTEYRPRTASLVVASRNRKKSAEIAALLAPQGIEVVSVADIPDVPSVVEDGSTFAANAAKKAAQTARHVCCWTLGEDSGLMVDALDGAPGIYSARYAGEDASDEENNRKLIAALNGMPAERRSAKGGSGSERSFPGRPGGAGTLRAPSGAGRSARYICTVAVADAQGNVRLEVSGHCRGRITRDARGTNGFGYDPYFEIPEYHRTFGELGAVVKQHLSHRARAFERLVAPLVRLLRDEHAPPPAEDSSA